MTIRYRKVANEPELDSRVIWIDTESSIMVPSNINHEIATPPLIGVLMSTYNGERYLEAQLESIASQEDVRVRLYVRDDGSTDGTPQLLSTWCTNNSYRFESVQLFCDHENVGYAASFLALLSRAEGCDYYAFADQDDWWEETKLARGVRVLASEEKGNWLYATCVRIVDENLKPNSFNSFHGLRFTLASEITRHRLAGHTMVWGDELQRFMLSLGTLPCQSHDQYVAVATILAGGSLLMDRSCAALHRRLSTSQTPGGAGIIKRMRHEMSIVRNKGDILCHHSLAKALMDSKEIYLNKYDRELIGRIVSQKQSPEKYVSLVTSSFIDCGLLIGNLEARISVLLGWF